MKSPQHNTSVDSTYSVEIQVKQPVGSTQVESINSKIIILGQDFSLTDRSAYKPSVSQNNSKFISAYDHSK